MFGLNGLRPSGINGSRPTPQSIDLMTVGRSFDELWSLVALQFLRGWLGWLISETEAWSTESYIECQPKPMATSATLYIHSFPQLVSERLNAHFHCSTTPPLAVLGLVIYRHRTRLVPRRNSRAVYARASQREEPCARAKVPRINKSQSVPSASFLIAADAQTRWIQEHELRSTSSRRRTNSGTRQSKSA